MYDQELKVLDFEKEHHEVAPVYNRISMYPTRCTDILCNPPQKTTSDTQSTGKLNEESGSTRKITY